MKKISLAIISLIFSLSAFCDAYRPVLHSKGTVRQQGFGGIYTTDKNSFEGMYANPAMLGERKKHSLFPSIQVNAGGDLDILLKVFQNGGSFDQQILIEALKGKERIVLKTDVLPLLSFGHTTTFGFGWGVDTQIYADGVIPSLSKSNINIGVESVLTFGFGFKILNFDNFKLNVGASVKGFVQTNVGYNGTPVAIMDYIQSLNTVPVDITWGFGFNAGVLLNFCKFFDAGIVWYDIYTPTFTQTRLLSEFKGADIRTNKIDGKLAVGVGFNIPVEKTKGVISTFKIMLDYRNVFGLFQKGQRNPILELSCGIDFALFKIMNFRIGISEMYPAAGFGLSFGTFKIDASIYGRELGLEPGSAPCVNGGINIGFNY